MVEYNFKLSENASISLDFIRVTAIFMVVIGHGITFMGIFPFLYYPNVPWMQNIGVVVFFLLSGFLITYSLFTKRNNSDYTFKGYFADRFSRIYSVYIPVLLILVGLDFIYFIYLGNSDVLNSYNVPTFIANLLMFQDPAPVIISFTSFGTSRPFWTLAMFWWIYMFFGWLVLGNRNTKSKILYIVILICLSYLLSLIITGPRSPKKITIFITWGAGALIALLLNIGQRVSDETPLEGNINRKVIPKIQSFFRTLYNSPKICFVFFVIFLILALNRVFYTKIAYDIQFEVLLSFALFFFLIVMNKTTFKTLSRVKKPIKILASYSFTIYLLHYSIFEILGSFVPEINPYILFIVALALSNVFSYIVAYYTEMRYKDFNKFLKSKYYLIFKQEKDSIQSPMNGSPE